MKTPNLTPLAQRLVAALREQPETWLTRRQLAKAIGKRQLSPYHLTILDDLKKGGLIEQSHRPNNTPIGYEWLYRVRAGVRY